LIFDIVIVLALFLSFFALTANMSANLFDQTKEIAVLRALGLTKTRVKLLYFYEAFVLIFASNFLGMCIGITVSYTISIM
jgi:ABC-type antimicrobial peptide transport system permease subunit